MAWVVDTCVLIDIADADPHFGVASAQFLDSKRPSGLLICPVTFVELAPVFGGDRQAQEDFLFNLDVSCVEPWTDADTNQSYSAWHNYVTTRRLRLTPKRPLADVLIGAFAQRWDGLQTRNVADFRQIFPNLAMETP
ncbi:MAG: hypothetical protein WCN98_04530 [Verrucomicrobiaceae bacterium]